MSEPTNHWRFDGKVALITGAAQGIGEATARLFALRGVAGLLLTDRNTEKGEAVAASLDVPTKFVAADLQNLPAVRGLVPAAEAVFGRLDVLCNVAASTERGSILDTDEALYERILGVNLRAPFFLMQDTAKLMRRLKIAGSMVNVSSVNAHAGAPFLAAYSASKAALVNLTRNTANALVRDRIRVNCVLPGWVDTPGEHETLKRFHNAKDNWLEEAEKQRPFGRLIKPDEVARAIAYLASDESGLMTGAVMDFDQGVPGAPGDGLGPMAAEAGR
jgi:NAD(P)-dependent dehydrogenase (short-subunit alcohol dehydrogenase family)